MVDANSRTELLRTWMQELRHERDKAAAIVAKCDQKIPAIEILLERSERKQPATAQKPFAALIRDMLAALGGRRGPKEIALAMIARGDARDLNGKLASRVGVELHRMGKSKSSPIRKVAPGKYIMDK